MKKNVFLLVIAGLLIGGCAYPDYGYYGPPSAGLTANRGAYAPPQNYGGYQGYPSAPPSSYGEQRGYSQVPPPVYRASSAPYMWETVNTLIGAAAGIELARIDSRTVRDISRIESRTARDISRIESRAARDISRDFLESQRLANERDRYHSGGRGHQSYGSGDWRRYDDSHQRRNRGGRY